MMDSDPVIGHDQWLRVGAKEKAASVVQLTQGLPIEDVLEVGCGTGAILDELDKQGYACRYWACEPSKLLFGQLQRKSISRLVEAACAPLDQNLFCRRDFDLVILSHVLEHVLAPAGLLAAALDRGRFVVVEVPLEGNFLGALRSKIRCALTRKPRTINSAGHVQFFSRSDIEKLAGWAGAQTIRARLYSPTAQLRFRASHGSWLARLYQKAVLYGENVFGEKLWAQLYYGHYALLCKRCEISSLREWSHEFYPVPGIY
jgi:SAM-dependent methyltransferase